MRAWLYDHLTTDPELQGFFGGPVGILERVMPRRSQGNILVPKPFLIYGLGNSTNEQLGDSTATDEEELQAERQFFQVWIHDEGGSYLQIDDIVAQVKKRLTGASDVPSRVNTVIYLETSQEFNNETYNTIFRYIRFQAIISQGVLL